MTGAARILRALVAKDLAVLAGRRGLWLARTGFVGILFASVAVAWLVVGEEAIRSGGVSALGRAVARTLTFSAYVASLFIGPAMVAGAIEEERDRGALEILIASPLGAGALIASLFGGRLLAVGGLLVAAFPLFAVPLFLGGVGPAELVVGIASIALGTSLGTSYAIWRTAKGESAQRVFRSAVVFIAATPVAPGLLGVMGGIGVTLCVLCLSPALAALYPFWGFGVGVLAGTPIRAAMTICPPALASAIAIPWFLGLAVRDLRAGASATLSAAPAPVRIERAREVAARSIERVLDRWGIPLALLGCAVFFSAFALPSPSVDLLPLTARLLLALCLLAAVVSACRVGSRTFPSRAQPGLLEALASTPIRGGTAVAEGLDAVFRRAWLLYAAIVALDLLQRDSDVALLDAVASLFLVVAVIALCYGVALWMHRRFARSGDAAAAALAVISLFGLGTVAMIPGDWIIAVIHPLRVWIEPGPESGWRMLASAVVTGLAAAILLVSFAASFDGAMGRPGATGAKA